MDALSMNHAPENRFTVAKRGWVGGVIEWKVGVSRCKLLYMEWSNNKVLLCITGVQAQKGGRYRRRKNRDNPIPTHASRKIQEGTSPVGSEHASSPTSQSRKEHCSPP